MRFLLLTAMLIGCGDNAGRVQSEVDAAIDPDAADVNFFGEPCELPTYPHAVRTCHCDDNTDGRCTGAHGFCVDERGDGTGTCRPWCDQTGSQWDPTYVCTGAKDGGRVWFNNDGSDPAEPHLCVCLPP